MVNEQKSKGRVVLENIKENWYIYIVLLIALFALLDLSNQMNDYQEKCNEHWESQIQPIIERCQAQTYDFYNWSVEDGNKE
jgi:hypothetical protein